MNYLSRNCSRISLKFVFSKFSTRTLNIKETTLSKYINEEVAVHGWVKSVRRHKNRCFIDVTDGTCVDRLQVVFESDGKSVPEYGSSVRVTGKLIKSDHKGQNVELHCTLLEKIGQCPEDYPFCNRTAYSVEYARTFPHLRPRTKTFSSIAHLNRQAYYSVHQYFKDNNFHFFHTPIITSNDCEGTGEMFTVNTTKRHNNESTDKKTLSLHHTKLDVAEDSGETSEVESLSDDLPQSIDIGQFFGQPTYLTGSAQLHLEALTSAFPKVFTFSPAFRTEGAHSKVHACEFQMIEAEMAFIESIEDLTKVVDHLIRNVAQVLLNECDEELSWLSEKYPSSSKDHVSDLVNKPFVYMTYAEAIEILQSNVKSLTSKIEFGNDFGNEHKNFIVQHCDNVPVFVTNMPSSLSPYYMKTNNKGMAYCFDVLAPFGGEICSGGLREDSFDVLKNKLEELKLQESLAWYLDLRKYGSVPHGGFGIGFERLLLAMLGLPNIRDVIPFPRWKYSCRM